MSRIRFVPILIVLSMTFAVLFGGWELYRNFGLVHPLEQQLMADKAVTNVQTVVDGTDREIKITLKPVADLQSTYEELEKTVTTTMGPQVKIDLVDTREQNLKNVYRSIQPILYSGMARGEFPAMIESAQKAAAAAGVKAQISMNDTDIFVQLQKNGHYLYEVLPYQATAIDTLKEVQSL